MIMRLRSYACLSFALVFYGWCGIGSGFLIAQDVTSPGTPDKSAGNADIPTIEQVQSRIAQLQADRSIANPLKQALIPIYESVVTELRLKSESEKQTKELAAKAEAAPTATLDAKRQQENPPARDLVSASALRSYQLAALQSLLQAQQSNVQAATDGRSKIEAAITAREAAKKELPRTIAEDRANLKKLNEKLAALPASEAQDPAIREAELLLLRASTASSAEKTRKNEQELRVIEAETELLPLLKAKYIADERYYSGRVKEIIDELNKRRETKIEEERLKVEALASEAPPDLKEQAGRLVLRSGDWLELAKKNSQLQIEIEQSDARRDALEERQRIMTDRSRTHRAQFFRGINSWNGLLLRRHRNELPDDSKLEKQLNELLTKMQQTESLIIELEDWKSQNIDPQQNDGLLANGIALSASPGKLVQQADRLLQAERSLVDSFITDAKSYFDNLSKLATIKQDTIGMVIEYRAFIDQQILWVRSAKPFGLTDLQQLWPAIQHALNYRLWKDAGKVLISEWREKPWLPMSFVLVWVVLLANAAKLRRLSTSLCDQAARTTTTAFYPTAQVALNCLLLAAPLPMVLVFVGIVFNKPVRHSRLSNRSG